jgi:ornithine cyclodeaminase/alanine dehydrogenase-like protein (mu-crystallin family)
MLILSDAEVATYLPSPREAAALMRDTFIQWRSGHVEVGSRGQLSQTPGMMQSMPAYLPAWGIAGMKWYAHYPRHLHSSGETINAVVVLNDPATGSLLAILDARTLTAVRTAAVTATSIEAAQVRRRSCVIVGTGRQARAHLHALAGMEGVEHVTVIGRTLAAAGAMVAQVTDTSTGTASAGQSALRAAVAAADVIITATNDYQREVLAGVEARPGQTYILVDNPGKEDGLLAQAQRVIVDDPDHFASPDVAGRFRTQPHSSIWLADLIAGADEVPRGAVTIVMNLGVGACDVALSQTVRSRALDHRDSWRPHASGPPS